MGRPNGSASQKKGKAQESSTKTKVKTTIEDLTAKTKSKATNEEPTTEQANATNSSENKKEDAIMGKLQKLIDLHTEQFNQLNNKLENLEKSLEDKIDQKIDEKLQTVHQKMATVNEKLEKVVENKVNNTLKKQILDEVKEVVHEHKERDRKACNIVFFNVIEPEQEDPGQRMESDVNFIVEICQEMGVHDATIKRLFRLGRNKPDDPEKARPLLVSFSSQEEKKRVLASAKNLKHTNHKDFKKVGLAPDLTPLQRKERKARLTKMRASKQNGPGPGIKQQGLTGQRSQTLADSQNIQMDKSQDSDDTDLGDMDLFRSQSQSSADLDHDYM